jgi:amino acid transporter
MRGNIMLMLKVRLISCPACGKEISSQAVSCPNCGQPISECISQAASPVSAYRATAQEITYPNRIGVYTPGQIAWATFLGSALGGGILIAINYKRLNKDDQIAKAIVLIVLGFVIVIIFGAAWTASPFIICGIQAAIMYYLAGNWQGKYIQEHMNLGGKIASSWGATGAGLVGTVAAIMVFVIFCILGIMSHSNS